MGQEDPLEKVMATHSSILAWEILGTGQPGELHGPLSSVGSSGSGSVTHLLFSIPPCNKEPNHHSLVTDHFDE